MPPGSSRLNRVHGAFVSENEIHQVVKFIADQGDPDYLDESVLMSDEDLDDADSDRTGDTDLMYEEAVRGRCTRRSRQYQSPAKASKSWL